MSKTILYCAATVLALTGCASEERHQQIADTSRAQTMVDQAEQAGAQQFAAADLEAARNKLQVAQNKKTDDEVAQRMAQEAAADAEVAVARTRAAKAQQAVTQVSAGHESLRQEANGQPQQAPPPPAPPIAAEPPVQEPPH
jgi:hypothetical protein